MERRGLDVPAIKRIFEKDGLEELLQDASRSVVYTLNPKPSTLHLLRGHGEKGAGHKNNYFTERNQADIREERPRGSVAGRQPLRCMRPPTS